jgi:nucleoside-diphosphate-sugar epimerase
MSVFVTGASGFLGGRLAEVLVEQGEEVFALTRPGAEMGHLAHLPIHIVRGDLGDVARLTDAVRDVRQIFHCAACATDWAPLDTYYRANVAGTQNLLAAAREATDLQRFVHVSTCDVYGYPRIPCDESHPLIDTGLPYNQTKCLGEAAVWKAQEDFGLPITILRPATIYGPRGKDFVVQIADLLRQGWMAKISSGREPGGFAYVDNVVDAILQASTCGEAEGQAFNIADGTGATWSEYLSAFAAELGYRHPWINLPFPVAMSLARIMEAPHRYLKVPGRPLLTRHGVYLLGVDQEFPIAKAQRAFSFSPRIGLAEGIARSVRWLKDTGRV